MGATSKWLFVPGLPSGSLEILKLGIPMTLGAHNFFVDLRLRWGLKQSCSPHPELSNDMWHATCTQGNLVDSWLLVVGSQTVNLTPDSSFFYHNPCFRCPNGSCELISDIYVPAAFQWYKEHLNSMSFDPCDRSLKIWESIKTPTPKVRVPLGMWGFIPSHSFAFPRAWNVIPGFPFGPHSCKPLPWSRAQG
jgi:hypothetical protein